MNYRRLVDHMLGKQIEDIVDQAHYDVRALQDAQPELGRDRVVAAESTALRELLKNTLTEFFERNLTKHSVI